MTQVMVAAQRGFFLTGMVLCGFWICQTARTYVISGQVPIAGAPVLRAPSGAGPAGSLLGRIEIPEAGVATAVLEGVDEEQLSVASGHVPHTAMPGGLGNFAVAGHRDTVFRNLRKVKPGMDVLVSCPSGRYRYRVRSVEVVSPDNVAVLETMAYPSLTLITCYPFHYIGPAPSRYCIRAELTGLM